MFCVQHVTPYTRSLTLHTQDTTLKAVDVDMPEILELNLATFVTEPVRYTRSSSIYRTSPSHRVVTDTAVTVVTALTVSFFFSWLYVSCFGNTNSALEIRFLALCSRLA